MEPWKAKAQDKNLLQWPREDWRGVLAKSAQAGEGEQWTKLCNGKINWVCISSI